MKWTFRWYGKDDPITLDHIRQIPDMYGVVGTLNHKLPGDLWTYEEVKELKDGFIEIEFATTEYNFDIENIIKFEK